MAFCGMSLSAFWFLMTCGLLLLCWWWFLCTHVSLVQDSFCGSVDGKGNKKQVQILFFVVYSLTCVRGSLLMGGKKFLPGERLFLIFFVYEINIFFSLKRDWFNYIFILLKCIASLVAFITGIYITYVVGSVLIYCKIDFLLKKLLNIIKIYIFIIYFL